MQTTIKQFFKTRVRVTPADGDTSVTIADLAMNVDFNTRDASKYDTRMHCIAYAALEEYYGDFEFEKGNNDYYDGCWMTFKDGSTIRIRAK